MDPIMVFCPNLAGHARGQAGLGNIGVHSRKGRRCICTPCHKTCTMTKGTRGRTTTGSGAGTSGRVAGQGPRRHIWMALAMLVRTRLWLAGVVSAHRDMTPLTLADVIAMHSSLAQ